MKSNIPLDIDGNKLAVGCRVAAIDSNRIQIQIGRIVCHTNKRIRCDFGGNKSIPKSPKSLVKIFNQEKEKK